MRDCSFRHSTHYEIVNILALKVLITIATYNMYLCVCLCVFVCVCVCVYLCLFVFFFSEKIIIHMKCQLGRQITSAKSYFL